MLERTPIQKVHTTIFDQSFSECGNYLAVCDNLGFVSVYRLSSALVPNPKKESYKPFYTFKASDYAIYSLLTNDGKLICGGKKALTCWSWTTIIDESAKIVWSVKMPSEGSCLTEANCLAVCQESSRLYAGCGDGLVHQWNIETGVYQTRFSGHTNVIQSINLQENLIYSASEDGTVRVWDKRVSQAQAQHVMTPSKDESLDRPSIGSWLACVCSQDDMVACGGAPKLSLWSLRTLSPLVSMDTGVTTQHAILFTDHVLVSGGTGKHIEHWYVNGERKRSLPVTPDTIYNISTNDRSADKKMLTACGTGCKVDACLNYGYRAFSFEI
ncbi:THO complex subunit 6 homolog [Watersipora subatra]|uniref:THO complex subunit 6 homolog n=1 Tax=Watersipora subatra TaxID=2589382 RepID=UPI00355BC298